MGEVAYTELKRLIINGALAPGSQWLEEELALRFGMSRTPIREALVRLEQDGLVIITPRRGVQVARLTRRDVVEVNDVLESLELLAVERVAALAPTPGDLAPLDDAVRAMDHGLATDDAAAWIAADFRFHASLISLTGNRHLIRTAHTYLERAHRFRVSSHALRGRPVASTTAHATTVEAIRRGDPHTAVAIHQLHKRRWAGELTQLFDRLGLVEGG